MNVSPIAITEKKALSWHTTYGDICVAEQCLRAGRRGPQVRPFCQRADISQRGYSLPLQRALVDFGSDESFLEATKKVREHYGVELPISAAREHTLAHAKAVGALEDEPAQPAQTLVTAFEEQFGADEQKAKFTLDFYQVSEHLGQAAEGIAPGRNKEWLQEQKGLLLENKVQEVLKTLEIHFEPLGQEHPPVRGAHQYMDKRKAKMDYKGARAAALPIGSGEVESGHRHVIQQRLKIAGAWWTLPNAEAMLQLRTTRAHNDWDRYWTELAEN